MPNYESGLIYYIVGLDQNEPVYVGSTFKKYISQRQDTHGYLYKRYKAGKSNYVTVYQLFDKYGFENCTIHLLEKVNTSSKEELRKREQHYIDTLSCINKYSAFVAEEDKKNRKLTYDRKYHKQYKFFCKYCEFRCSRPSHMDNHKNTKKHTKIFISYIGNWVKCHESKQK